jgi:23S rRNA (cytidine1920-2'-O)/16S rRNA (cytidine1409-2'-O)-methyltransferase
MSSSAGGRVKRRRADQLTVERGLAPTREKAQALILAGEVLREGRPVAKPGALLPAGAILERRSPRRQFVSRGGNKLEGALAALALPTAGILAWDVGASTGGFTDCLLRRGAARVVAIDVGRGQIDAALRADARVELREGVNARYLRADQLPGPPDLVVVDVSFISLDKVLPAIAAAAPAAPILSLVKPQFEVGRGKVGRGGIVRDEALQEQALEHLCARGNQWGLAAAAVLESCLRGAGGNREFFVHWVPGSGKATFDWARAVREAVYGSAEKDIL